jgi:hypothetical protein
MAVKGAVIIEANEDDSYTVPRTDGVPQDLSQGEKAVWDELFGRGSESVTLSATYDPSIRRAVELLASLIRKDYTDVYFRVNRGAWLGGAILAVATGAIAAVVDAQTIDDIFTVAFLSVFGLGFSISTRCSAADLRRSCSRSPRLAPSPCPPRWFRGRLSC